MQQLNTQTYAQHIPIQKQGYYCLACGKNYTSKQNLQKHYDRQPVCKRWINNSELDSRLKSYVNKHIDEEREHEKNCRYCEEHKDGDKKEKQEKCSHNVEDNQCIYCDKLFSTVGNLNKHIKNNIICKKWKKYMEVKELFDSLNEFNNKIITNTK